MFLHCVKQVLVNSTVSSVLDIPLPPRHGWHRFTFLCTYKYTFISVWLTYKTAIYVELLRGCSNSMELQMESGKKLIKADLKCSCVAQNTIKRNLETLKELKMYKQSHYGYHRNWPILSVQFFIITGYYHTKYTIKIKITVFFSRK